MLLIPSRARERLKAEVSVIPRISVLMVEKIRTASPRVTREEDTDIVGSGIQHARRYVDYP